MPKKFLKNDICHNCKTHIGDYNFCPNCGQVNSHRQIRLTQIIKDLLGDYFTFDSKFFRSIWPLVGKPGHLTIEYISGRRNTYILPLRLYIFTTFLFFFVLSLMGTIDPYNIDESKKNQVTEDSLRQFFGAYENDLSEYYRETILMDIGDHYKLEKIKPRNDKPTLRNAIKNHLLDAKPALADTMAAVYARRLTRRFSFSNKESLEKAKQKFLESMDDSYIPSSVIDTTKLKIEPIKPEDKILMRKLLLEYRFSNQEMEKFFSKIDSIFSYKKRNWQRKNVNVTFSGQDTASSAFMRKLEKKAEYIFAQGSKGWAIFWSELIRQIPKIMFLVLPLFALLLKLFYVRQKIFYFNHLIFALHVHSLLFMYLIIAILIPNGWVIGFSILAIWVHTFVAFNNVYSQGKILTFFKLNTILLIYLFVNIFAFILLSMLTVWSV